ncbi:glycine N-methyltransferase-like [Anneissia japonica]|uniref:glycine N-methyltransferase-like n=1 Tax=Anneissia japonica TaxID=1529436 RepID=UPI00142566CA|nr:glycine N-methyltransferase-like [Anneissia japonica]
MSKTGTERIDSVFRTRSLGIPAEGIRDQYADGKAAKVWECYIGTKSGRIDYYKDWIVELLKSKNCKSILDVACGTGIDSIMLLESGFMVTSCDASDKMIMHAFKERWARRKEEAFDQWEIDIANWLTLPDDIDSENGFDCVICLGNSFAHLPDFDGDLRNIRKALKNFAYMVKPGGIMIIDHRNYDAILDTGRAPVKNIYYQGNCVNDIQTSVLYVNGKSTMVTLDYFIDIDKAQEQSLAESSRKRPKLEKKAEEESIYKFRLSYYPHRLKTFSDLLIEAFGSGCKHTVYGDYKPLNEVEVPAYYIHVIEKPAA